MPEPAAASRSSLSTVVAVLLAVGLAGAIAYIGQLRGQINALQAQLAVQTAQLQPFLDAARSAYPDADVTTALGSVAQRLTAPPRAAAPRGAAVAAAEVRIEEFMPADKQESVLQILRNEPDSGRKAWFLVAQGNAEAQGAQAALQTLFEQSGWPVDVVRAPYPLKAGVYILAGDETPPAFVDTANAALTSGGLEVQYLTGYRAFVEERKATNPNWVGPELAADQPFTIVIGSKPAPAME